MNYHGETLGLCCPFPQALSWSALWRRPPSRMHGAAPPRSHSRGHLGAMRPALSSVPLRCTEMSVYATCPLHLAFCCRSALYLRSVCTVLIGFAPLFFVPCSTLIVLWLQFTWKQEGVLKRSWVPPCMTGRKPPAWRAVCHVWFEEWGGGSFKCEHRLWSRKHLARARIIRADWVRGRRVVLKCNYASSMCCLRHRSSLPARACHKGVDGSIRSAVEEENQSRQTSLWHLSDTQIKTRVPTRLLRLVDVCCTPAAKEAQGLQLLAMSFPSKQEPCRAFLSFIKGPHTCLLGRIKSSTWSWFRI